MTTSGSSSNEQVAPPAVQHGKVNGQTQREATFGAPVEEISPLGTHLNLKSAVFLNLSDTIGMGIFSVPGIILRSVGSIGMALTLWILGAAISFAGLSMYIELASMFPKRSGTEVVYLEQAYPRPKYLLSTTFAVCTVLTSLAAVNAIAFAQYALYAFDVAVTPGKQKILALACLTCSIAICAFSTRWSIKISNVLSILKVGFLVVVPCTGLAVLLGLTSAKSQIHNFKQIFEGTTWNGNALATALVKVDYSFFGWSNSINLLAEVPASAGTNPIQTLRRAGYLSLWTVSLLFILANISYFVVIPKERMKDSGVLVGAVFFDIVFGEGGFIARKVFPAFVALNCVGSIIAGTIATARVARESGRQGVLPYPDVWASTYPFGTPLAPIMLKFVLVFFVIVAPPAGDAFNLLVDLSSYPRTIFAVLICIGLGILRKRRAIKGEVAAPEIVYRAWDGAVNLYLVKSILTIVMPWIPPANGSHSGDVSLWYATYCVLGLGIMALCGIYYYVWIILLPRLRGYEIVEETVTLPDGAVTNHFTRKYINAKSGASSNTAQEPAPTEATPLLSSS
ncbi:hypothetical protein FRC03_007295 [Tulasnella sp. 419]|nr:hypothetical protein FRC03_007295 [Tulasnella sp. 419]